MWVKMSDYLKIYEVGPRDGLQNETVPIDTNQKLKLIESLVSAGLRQIEVTSFVHPKAVPQMADADDVMRMVMNGYDLLPVKFVGLVFNQRGYDRAIAADCRAMAFGISVSDTFSMRNTRMTTAEALRMSKKLVAQAKNLEDASTAVLKAERGREHCAGCSSLLPSGLA